MEDLAFLDRRHHKVWVLFYQAIAVAHLDGERRRLFELLECDVWWLRQNTPSIASVDDIAGLVHDQHRHPEVVFRQVGEIERFLQETS